MLVLEYVNVHEEYVRLEGRYIDSVHESIDVLIGKLGLLQGRITYADGEGEWLDTNVCVCMANLLNPPKHVMGVIQTISNPGWEERDEPHVWLRAPALSNWIRLTYSVGVHEMTTEYETSYA